MRLWGRKNKLRFVPAKLTEHSGPDTNPGRGWYQMFTLDIAKPVNIDSLKGSLCESDRFALLLIDIGSCRACNLTEEMLEHLERIFGFFSEQRQEMIVRIAYDTEGKGLEREPASLNQVLRHMHQIGPVLQRFSGQIHTLQGLFVGSWGEMHGSRYLSDGHLKILAETLWDAIGGSCCLSVRTPRQRRILEQSKIDTGMVGLFVDGLFGSETHLGTFGGEEDASGREQAWAPERELSYLSVNCIGVPNGGETVLGERVPAGKVIQTLESMHLTYLNRVYDPRLLNRWKQEYLPDGQSLYDYVGSHLGYRFVLKKAWLKTVKGKPSIFLTGENQGFGNLLRESHVWLLVLHSGNVCFRHRLDADPRRWDSKKEFTFSFSLPGHPARQDGAQRYEFYVVMKTGREFIRFANAPEEEMVYLGTLSGWEI